MTKSCLNPRILLDDFVALGQCGDPANDATRPPQLDQRARRRNLRCMLAVFVDMRRFKLYQRPTVV